jgi:hypothetical protein
MSPESAACSSGDALYDRWQQRLLRDFWSVYPVEERTYSVSLPPNAAEQDMSVEEGETAKKKETSCVPA